MVDVFLVFFLRNLHTLLHNDCICLHSHQQGSRLLFSPHPLQHLLFIVFFFLMILSKGQGWALNPSLLDSSFNPDLLPPSTVSHIDLVTEFIIVCSEGREVCLS